MYVAELNIKGTFCQGWKFQCKQNVNQVFWAKDVNKNIPKFVRLDWSLIPWYNFSNIGKSDKISVLHFNST